MFVVRSRRQGLRGFQKLKVPRTKGKVSVHALGQGVLPVRSLLGPMSHTSLMESHQYIALLHARQFHHELLFLAPHFMSAACSEPSLQMLE
jgi:hypothetical protein